MLLKDRNEFFTRDMCDTPHSIYRLLKCENTFGNVIEIYRTC